MFSVSHIKYVFKFKANLLFFYQTVPKFSALSFYRAIKSSANTGTSNLSMTTLLSTIKPVSLLP